VDLIAGLNAKENRKFLAHSRNRTRNQVLLVAVRLLIEL
jgi:hypothetical protein